MDGYQEPFFDLISSFLLHSKIFVFSSYEKTRFDAEPTFEIEWFPLSFEILVKMFSLRFIFARVFFFCFSRFVIVNRKSSHHFHVSIYENNVIEYQTERDSNYVLNSMHVHGNRVFIAPNLCIWIETEKSGQSDVEVHVAKKEQTRRIRNAFRTFDRSNKGQKLPINAAAHFERERAAMCKVISRVGRIMPKKQDESKQPKKEAELKQAARRISDSDFSAKFHHINATNYKNQFVRQKRVHK